MTLPVIARPEVTLPKETYDRFVARARALGKSPQALLEQIMVAVLPAAPEADLELEDDAGPVVGLACRCCPGGCEHWFRFRGTKRCGCDPQVSGARENRGGDRTS